MRDEMVAKRLRKLARLAGETVAPERRPDRHAAALACCFGSTRGAVREAVDRLRRKGMDIGMLHFSEVWPFPGDRVRELTRRSRRLYTVEGNHTAQLAQLLAQECRLRTDGSVRRWDGRPLTVAEIERGLAELESREE
jgi:2-oxoglutarate ferredoxin oxidoreductase subunit alpha